MRNLLKGRYKRVCERILENEEVDEYDIDKINEYKKEDEYRKELVKATAAIGAAYVVSFAWGFLFTKIIFKLSTKKLMNK